MPNLDIDALLSHIVVNLPQAAAEVDASNGNKSWTVCLKRLLETYGSTLGFNSEYTDSSRHMSEFLLDFIWWDKRNPCQQQMALAMESEWYNLPHWAKDKAKTYAEAVATDFYKLLVVKSPYKLMMFSSEGGSSRDLIVKRLEEDITTFVGHVNGEHYLLLDTSPNNDWGAYELVISKDGACNGHFTQRPIIRE